MNKIKLKTFLAFFVCFFSSAILLSYGSAKLNYGILALSTLPLGGSLVFLNRYFK